MIYDIREEPRGDQTIVDPIDATRRKTFSNTNQYEDLLKPVVRDGKVIIQKPTLDEIRARRKKDLALLHPATLRFLNPHRYPVGLEVVASPDEERDDCEAASSDRKSEQRKSMKAALLLIDLQNDFLPGGSLAVGRGDEVIAVANRWLERRGRDFELAIASQDWHPRAPRQLRFESARNSSWSNGHPL